MSDASAVLSFALPGGRPATLNLTPEATVLGVDEVTVSSYDLAGRPYALVRDGFTWRRALDGRLLQKGIAPGGARRLRRLLPPEEGAGVVEAARRDAEELLAAVRVDPAPAPELRREAVRRLERIVSLDAPALRADAARFAATYHPVGILPPDQYLALVVQLTEGCSWSACTFCDFYRGVRFRAKTLPELEAHMERVRAFFGEALSLRRGLFLGSANALCLAHERLLVLVEAVARRFPAPRRRSPRGLSSFVDAWTGRRKNAAEYREYARLGLVRVYVGLETGDPELLAWLDKPGSPGDAVELVATLHEAGIAAGVIVLLGAGGDRFARSHERATAEALSRMGLGPDDFLYFSELVEHPALAYARRAARDGIRSLSAEDCARQREAIATAFRPRRPGRGPHVATYDIREFVY